MGVNGEALQLHVLYKSRLFYCKSRENPYQYYKSHENPYQYYKSCENPYQVPDVTLRRSFTRPSTVLAVIEGLGTRL